MTKYIVVELQTDVSGAVANLVYSYDEQAAAESKYHLILSSAAISQLPKHVAVLMTSEGYLMESRCYDRTQGETEGGEE